MKKLSRFLIISLILLGGCQSNSQKARMKDGIAVIDISKNYPAKEINSNLIVGREYVPLETTKDTILGVGAGINYVSEKYIVITESRMGIYIFDRNGKIVSHISRRGRGQEEYTVMSSVVFDEKNKEIFVFSNAGIGEVGQILVYSIAGEHKRTIGYPADLELTAYDFDNENILVYDSRGLNQNNYRDMPYLFLSKEDGSIISTLDINLPVRYSSSVIIPFRSASGGGAVNANISLGIPNRRHDGQDFIIGDISSDTIYRLTREKELKPFIVTKPSVHSTNPHVASTPVMITDNFIILWIASLDYAAVREGRVRVLPGKTLMYEFESRNIYSIDYNGDLAGVHTLQKNTDANLLNIYGLNSAYNNKGEELEWLMATLGEEDEKRLLEELGQFVDTLHERDNPVVVITKYK